mmetsp:Transcript_14225/g.60148  ORF Transcript_14225/g.60148 Transcript_14225/m.60148 type:complete len:238 (+) Transcript_14225:235-948(+)
MGHRRRHPARRTRRPCPRVTRSTLPRAPPSRSRTNPRRRISAGRRSAPSATCCCPPCGPSRGSGASPRARRTFRHPPRRGPPRAHRSARRPTGSSTSSGSTRRTWRPPCARPWRNPASRTPPAPAACPPTSDAARSPPSPTTNDETASTARFDATRPATRAETAPLLPPRQTIHRRRRTATCRRATTPRWPGRGARAPRTPPRKPPRFGSNRRARSTLPNASRTDFTSRTGRTRRRS